MATVYGPRRIAMDDPLDAFPGFSWFQGTPEECEHQLAEAQHANDIFNTELVHLRKTLANIVGFISKHGTLLSAEEILAEINGLEDVKAAWVEHNDLKDV